ncbi:hypothetical protein B0H13DRAFT_2564415 [Mycena leptocephala]|nr:hypothetical protein B0H13DRAFT_2564415 [Mycena leptocephala]
MHTTLRRRLSSCVPCQWVGSSAGVYPALTLGGVGHHPHAFFLFFFQLHPLKPELIHGLPPRTPGAWHSRDSSAATTTTSATSPESLRSKCTSPPPALPPIDTTNANGNANGRDIDVPPPSSVHLPSRSRSIFRWALARHSRRRLRGFWAPDGNDGGGAGGGGEQHRFVGGAFPRRRRRLFLLRLLLCTTVYKIVHNPQTVDLLVSLTYFAAAEGVVDKALPNGKALCIPRLTSAGVPWVGAEELAFVCRS